MLFVDFRRNISPTLLVFRSIPGGVCAQWLSLLKIAKLNRVVSCVLMEVCWRSVLPMNFRHRVVGGSVSQFSFGRCRGLWRHGQDRFIDQQGPQGTERECPRLYSERHEDPRKDWDVLPAMVPKASLLVT